ncbi:complement C1q-like protein 2 [Ruditapes philippinarum]|uniref:complement C1q-like protein 2 n=1 Tax=Ruditapes philippinarum TaxID=129788 RepID=UPI00295AE544|nr:complement C1q-like protein 2 [Ruditapes philippinarum]
MKKQIDDMQTRVTEALAKLNKDTATWKGEIGTLQENSKTNLATLQEKAKTNLDKNIEAVKDLKDRFVTPNIAFYAKKMKNNSPADGNTIVFTDIALNLGESYNTDTGIFIAPLGGIYLFTVQLCTLNDLRIYIGLVVDDVYMDTAWYEDNDHTVCCFKLTTTVSVKSGNKVWVKVIGRTGSGQILFHSDSHYWTSFSGVLINKD